MRIRFCLGFVLALICLPLTLPAQDASLAPSDIAFTRKIAEKYHVSAKANIEFEDNKVTHFQYDHYPEKSDQGKIERIKCTEGVFVRSPDKDWMKSEDWGKTGTPVKELELNQKLGLYVSVVRAQFADHHDHDPTQGKPVWKLIKQSKDETFTYYTYERSREHPNPDGVYPRCTFMRAAGDTDGQLFMCGATGKLTDEAGTHFPFSIDLIYLIPIPAGTQVKIYDKDTGKEKVNTVVGKHSGYEMTAQTSTPPKDE